MSQHLKNQMIRDLITSTYLDKVITDSTIDFMTSKLPLELNNDDKILIYLCLKKYPCVLYNTLKKCNDPRWAKIMKKEKDHSIIDKVKYTKHFMIELKNWAYQDMRNDWGPFTVNFNTSITIKNEEKNFTHTHSNEVEIVNNPQDRFNAKIVSLSWYSDFNEFEIRNFLVDEVVREIAAKACEISNLEPDISTREKVKQENIDDKKLLNKVEDKKLFVKGNGEKINRRRYRGYSVYIEDNIAPY